jgi:glycosyltransferase involved in cell wall biosynthesis
MKLALVHDWLRVNAGSEKVVAEILETYRNDEVTLYTLFNHLEESALRKRLSHKRVKVSPLHYLPGVTRNYRYLLPLMPMLIRSFKLKGYDLIISSSHAVAKGFRRDKNIPHICYCHTPMRYAWDLYKDYSADSHSLKSFLYRLVVRYIRNWDYRSASNVDFFLANSENVRQRILNNYGREAEVLYPPVCVDDFKLSEAPRENFYLCVGRFVPYKKIDVIIQAFRHLPDQKLVLIGDGYGAKKITKLISDMHNVIWLGYKDDEELVRYMQRAKACIFAAKEDFGIMCVEAQACGTPVLALNEGGYKETVVPDVTGYLFDGQTEGGVLQAIRKFEEHPLTAHSAIRENAERFSATAFRNGLVKHVNRWMQEFKQQKRVNA